MDEQINSTETKTIYTIGYGRWPSQVRLAKLIHALKANGITCLIDSRHSPCSSSLSGNYGPTGINLQAGGRDGIEPALLDAGIEYHWLVELGNPQKRDPAMAVLREHLAQHERYPVGRGIKFMREIMDSCPDNRVCLLCACKEVNHCHRKLIAEKFTELYYAPGIQVVHL